MEVGLNSEREVGIIKRFNWVLNPRSKCVLSGEKGGAVIQIGSRWSY